MDPLPLSINQHQLKLMQDCTVQAITALQDKHQSEFSDDKREQNLLTYGTDQYEEAHALLQAVDDQLTSSLETWNNAPDDSKPVPLDLNSYQIKLLRACLEQKAEQPLVEDILEQLPESSPQEDAD